MKTQSSVPMPAADEPALSHLTASVLSVSGLTPVAEPMDWPLAGGVILVLSGLLWTMILRLVL